VRILLVPLVIVIALLVIALVLPTRHDRSIALWWARVRYQADFFAQVALVFASIAGLVWYVLLPLLGWRSAGTLTP
jgi:hypothetical protein